MIKKGFTLLEIIITLALIGVVLSMVTGLGQSFSDKIRFANIKETVTATIQNIVSEAATTNSVTLGSGTQIYGNLSVFIASGSTISRRYSSGELNTDITYSTDIPRGILQSSGFSILLKPYAIGCDTASGSNFTVVSADNLHLKACYEVQSATCKLRQISCE